MRAKRPQHCAHDRCHINYFLRRAGDVSRHKSVSVKKAQLALVCALLNALIIFWLEHMFQKLPGIAFFE